jgi:hypothetical protein
MSVTGDIFSAWDLGVIRRRHPRGAPLPASKALAGAGDARWRPGGYGGRELMVFAAAIPHAGSKMEFDRNFGHKGRMFEGYVVPCSSLLKAGSSDTR